jgi:Holliday junction resolvase RusA-like endonuclease
MVSDSKHIIQLLQLRKLRLKPGFIMSFDGELLRKGRLDSKEVEAKFASELESNLRMFSWKVLPRARVAVTMSFFANSEKAPLLHNLVKFYMDLLKGAVFQDDRQVYCLEAHFWRAGHRREEPKLYLRVDRITDYKRKLDFYFEFKDQVGIFDPGTQIVEDSQYLSIIRNKAELQEIALARNSIEPFERPGNPGEFLKDFVRSYQRLHPLIINLGDLPERGKSDEYRKRIRNQFIDFREKSSVFKGIIIPVELDVQVTPRVLKLGKDLDNIMCDICPILNEELLFRTGYLNAFRIYVTDKLAEDSCGSIRVKLLPYGAIHSFRMGIDEVLEKAEELLEDKVY